MNRLFLIGPLQVSLNILPQEFHSQGGLLYKKKQQNFLFEKECTITTVQHLDIRHVMFFARGHFCINKSAASLLAGQSTINHHSLDGAVGLHSYGAFCIYPTFVAFNYFIKRFHTTQTSYTSYTKALKYLEINLQSQKVVKLFTSKFHTNMLPFNKQLQLAIYTI